MQREEELSPEWRGWPYVAVRLPVSGNTQAERERSLGRAVAGKGQVSGATRTGTMGENGP